MSHTGPDFQITSKYSGFDLIYHKVPANIDIKTKFEKTREKFGKNPGKIREKSGENPGKIREKSGKNPGKIREKSGNRITFQKQNNHII